MINILDWLPSNLTLPSDISDTFFETCAPHKLSVNQCPDSFSKLSQIHLKVFHDRLIDYLLLLQNEELITIINYSKAA